MEWGAEEDFLLGLLAEGEIPAALLSRPSLKRHLLPIWDAFHALAGDRQLGMGIGPIPFTAIDRYAARFGINDRDEFHRFHALISAMDAAHQKHWADKVRDAARG